MTNASMGTASGIVTGTLATLHNNNVLAGSRVRERYREAESRHNASSAVIEWVKVRNGALGEAEPNDAAIAAVKRMVVRDLTDIAVASWQANRRADDGRRAKTLASLGDRLRWKKCEDVQ